MKLTVLSVAYSLVRVSTDTAGGAEQIVAMLDDRLALRGHRSLVMAAILESTHVDGPFARTGFHGISSIASGAVDGDAASSAGAVSAAGESPCASRGDSAIFAGSLSRGGAQIDQLAEGSCGG